MNTEDFRGAALVPPRLLQNALDEFLLEFLERLFEKNSPIHHHADQRLQLLFHVCALRENRSGTNSQGQSSAWPVIC